MKQSQQRIQLDERHCGTSEALSQEFEQKAIGLMSEASSLDYCFPLGGSVSNLETGYFPNDPQVFDQEVREPSVSSLDTSEVNTPSTKSSSKKTRENRYKNASPVVKARRRAQNRASQRAYRERKEQRIRELEQLLEEAHSNVEKLNQAFEALGAENSLLKAVSRRNNFILDVPPTFIDQQGGTNGTAVISESVESGVLMDMNLFSGPTHDNASSFLPFELAVYGW